MLAVFEENFAQDDQYLSLLLTITLTCYRRRDIRGKIQGGVDLPGAIFAFFSGIAVFLSRLIDPCIPPPSTPYG